MVNIEAREQRRAAIAAEATLPAEPLLAYFNYAHLPEKLQVVSSPFSTLAEHIMTLPRSAERAAGLRKLLEAKDCAVRAALPPTE